MAKAYKKNNQHLEELVEINKLMHCKLEFISTSIAEFRCAREFEEKKKASEEQEAKALEDQKKEYQKLFEVTEVLFPTAAGPSSEEIKASQASPKKAPVKVTKRKLNAN